MSEIEDELEAINSIYDGCMIEWASSIYDIAIPESDVVVRLSFPTAYPAKKPSLMAIVKGSRFLSRQFNALIDRIFVPDQVIVFDFIEGCREIIENDENEQEESEEREEDATPTTSSTPSSTTWIESEPVTDRKSLFIARVSSADSSNEALQKINLLKSDRKISKATHNITAYRIKRNDNIIVQDCDDDGEDAAGGRLMHLLTLTDSINVVICVSRYYGGIKLGPDRFKHINSTARDALVHGGFIVSKPSSSKKSH